VYLSYRTIFYRKMKKGVFYSMPHFLVILTIKKITKATITNVIIDTKKVSDAKQLPRPRTRGCFHSGRILKERQYSEYEEGSWIKLSKKCPLRVLIARKSPSIQNYECGIKKVGKERCPSSTLVVLRSSASIHPFP
jgi:hypothetical protein